MSVFGKGKRIAPIIALHVHYVKLMWTPPTPKPTTRNPPYISEL